MENETNRESGDDLKPEVKENGEAVTEAAKTYTQEDINRILAKELKPFKAIKTEYEKLQQAQKEKEQAELSELDKLKQQLKELEGFKITASEYEETFTELIQERVAMIPDDKKSLIPEGYSNAKLLKWLGQNEKLLGISGVTSPSSPTGGKPPTGPADTLQAKAEEKVRVMYAHDRSMIEGSDKWKLAVERVKTQLKALG